MTSLYLTKIFADVNPSKYTEWYTNIISRGKSRAQTRSQAIALLGYVEGHHILPRCMCTDKSQISDKDNIVFLSAREHFICHILLTKIFPTNMSLLSAACKMKQSASHQYRYLNNRLYETVRRDLSAMCSVEYAKRKWWNNGEVEIHCEVCPEGYVPGRTWSPSAGHRQITSRVGKARVLTDEQRVRMSLVRKGCQFTDEHRHNMSVARRKSEACLQHALANQKKMVEINTGKTRPEHSEYMKQYAKDNPKGKIYYTPLANGITRDEAIALYSTDMITQWCKDSDKTIAASAITKLRKSLGEDKIKLEWVGKTRREVGFYSEDRV